MTKPVSRLEWWPQPTDPLGVRLLWIGAPWNYLVDWGDGTELEQVPAFQFRPVPHRYPMAGRYLVRAHPQLPNATPIQTEIVVRAALPNPMAEHISGGAVRVHLDEVDEPVRYQIAWGDGDHSEHGFGDWTPQHTYRNGITRPPIVIRDDPARRLVEIEGPAIARTRFPRWVFTGFDDRLRSTLWVGDLTPDAEWTVYGWQTGNPVVGQGTVPLSGQISVEVDLSGNPDNLENLWTPFTLVEHHPDWGERRVYAAFNEDYAYGVYCTYAWHRDDPNLIGLALFRAPRHGNYTIDWGDGTTADRLDWNDGWTVRAIHRYAKPGSYGIRVTAPDGTSGGVMVGPCRLNGSRFNGSDFLEFFVADHPDTSTNFLPVLVDWGDGRGPVVRLPAVRVPNPSASAVTERHYGTEFHSREMTARWWAHWTGEDSRTITINHGRRRGRRVRPATVTAQPTGDGGYTVTSTLTLDPRRGDEGS